MAGSPTFFAGGAVDLFISVKERAEVTLTHPGRLSRQDNIISQDDMANFSVVGGGGGTRPDNDDRRRRPQCIAYGGYIGDGARCLSLWKGDKGGEEPYNNAVQVAQ